LGVCCVCWASVEGSFYAKKRAVLQMWDVRRPAPPIWDIFACSPTILDLSLFINNKRSLSIAKMPAASPPEKQTSQPPPAGASHRPDDTMHAPSTPPSTPPPALRAPVLAVLKKFPACGGLFYSCMRGTFLLRPQDCSQGCMMNCTAGRRLSGSVSA
jgi:hypothetical protein